MAVIIINLTIEERAKETSTIEEVEVVKALIVNLLNSILSINFNKINQVLVVLDQKDQHAKSVESLYIWLFIAIIGWTMLIKASIHLPSLL